MPWSPFGDNGKSTTSMQLAKEASKLARLGNVQNGLPGAMRGLPVAAIVAGKVYGKMVSKADNDVVEKAILGDHNEDRNVMQLQAPSSETMALRTEDEEDGRAGETQHDGGINARAKLNGPGEVKKSASQDIN